MNEDKKDFENDFKIKFNAFFRSVNRMPASIDEFILKLNSESDWTYEFSSITRELMNDLICIVNFEKNKFYLEEICSSLDDFLKMYSNLNCIPSKLRELMLERGYEKLYDKYTNAQLDIVIRIKEYIETNSNVKINFIVLKSEVVSLFCIIVKENFPEYYHLENYSNSVIVSRICKKYKIFEKPWMTKLIGMKDKTITLENIELLKNTMFPLLEKEVKDMTEKAILYYLETQPQLKMK